MIVTYTGSAHLQLSNNHSKITGDYENCRLYFIPRSFHSKGYLQVIRGWILKLSDFFWILVLTSLKRLARARSLPLNGSPFYTPLYIYIYVCVCVCVCACACVCVCARANVYVCVLSKKQSWNQILCSRFSKILSIISSLLSVCFFFTFYF